MKAKRKFLSKKQIKGIKYNWRSMSAKTQRQYTDIFLFIIPRTIKGKLGFDLRTKDSSFKQKAKAIFDAITANTGGFYIPAFALLPLLGTQITDFQKAMDNMALGILGAEAAKTEAKIVLKITLDSALGYINNLAFLDQLNAAEIITGAKMELLKSASVNKQDFTVKQGNATGEVKLISLAGKFNNKPVKTIYNWQYSTDNGLTWISLDSTIVAKTVAADMAVDIKTLFRKRTITVKGGTSAWCAPLAITPV